MILFYVESFFTFIFLYFPHRIQIFHEVAWYWIICTFVSLFLFYCFLHIMQLSLIMLHESFKYALLFHFTFLRFPTYTIMFPKVSWYFVKCTFVSLFLTEHNHFPYSWKVFIMCTLISFNIPEVPCIYCICTLVALLLFQDFTQDQHFSYFLNILREERTGDREHIQIFHPYQATPEEQSESLRMV